MKILHLTDFHYSNDLKNAHDQNKVVDALLNELSKINKNDLVFFTGDLVFSGKKMEDFNEAKKILLDRIHSELSIPKSNIFICGGNHDIYRGQELIDTTDKIKDINSDLDLEEYIKRQEGKSFSESLKNLSHYQEFEKTFYSEYSPLDSTNIKELYTVHKRTIDGKKIGIVTINSAWRAIDSKTDRGNLLFPISILKKAIEEAKINTEIRILLMHHPISDFKDWNASDLEDIIHKEFLLLFSGHLHKKKQSIYICNDEGIFCCSSAATLALDNSNNGFSFIDVDLDTYDIEILNCHYLKTDGSFLYQDPISTTIPVGEIKKEAINFKRILRKKYTEEVERADELFISFDEKEKNKGFLELFTAPVLKNKTKAQISESKADVKNFNLSNINSKTENVVIFGKDKSGKTSILYKIFLELLVDFTIHKTIPIYIDVKEYKNSKKELNIYKHINQYYEMNIAKAKDIPNKYDIKLLIDNYDPNFTSFNVNLNSFIKTHAKISFIVSTEEKLATSFASYEFDGRTYSNLYIHDISRPEVRLLANKWPNLTPEKRELIFEKIFDIFSQLNIPSNYWTVSLFIWIFEKNNDANFHNSFELIQLYIDNLLDRKSLALDKSSKIKFDDLKSYLAELSYFLMFERSEKGYTATYTEIVDFTNKYRKKNKRFVIEVKDIIALIIEKGILRKVFDESYTFRLNGVLEYFLALYMTIDEKFLNDIIKDEHYYLSFKNELELFAGFEKNNKKFLDKIFNRTKAIFQNVHTKYSQTNIDTQLMLRVSQIFDITLPIAQLGENIKKSLPVEKQDELLSEWKPTAVNKSEVKIKEYYETIEDNAENLEKALHILSRVFRNSNIQDDKQLNDILDYILDSFCYLGFTLIDETDINDLGMKTESFSEDDEKMLLQLITNFMPLIVQTFLYDAMAQSDLTRIFEDKIIELKQDAKNNQFKLMLLYFTLIDLDINANKHLIKEIINTVNLTILRQTTIIKLYGYLMFKCTNKPHLEEFIKEQIQAQTLKINPKTDLGSLQKGLSKTSSFVRLKGYNKKGRG